MQEFDIRKVLMNPQYQRLKNEYNKLLDLIEYYELNFIDKEEELKTARRKIKKVDTKISNLIGVICFGKNK